MKFFVLIFVSLFFIQAHADDAEDSCAISYPFPAQGVSDSLSSKRENCINEKRTKEAKTTCDANYKEYYTAKKEALSKKNDDQKDAQDEIMKLQEKKNDITNKAQEDLANKDKELTTAQEDYKKASDDTTEALNKLEEDTNTQADQKVRDLQADMAKLQKLTTVDMDKINTDYQNDLNKNYADCKNTAEQLFAARIGLDRQNNKLENHGLKKSGGATFATASAIKKAKTEATSTYSKCIAEVNRVVSANRDSATKSLQAEQNSTNQEINNKKVELDRLTNGEYTKKVNMIQEKLRTAQLEFTNKQNQINTDKQRLQQKMQQDLQSVDQQIMVYQQRAGMSNIAGSTSKDATEDSSAEACTMAQSACCKGETPISGVTVTRDFCKMSCDGKSKRRHRDRGSNKGAS